MKNGQASPFYDNPFFRESLLNSGVFGENKIPVSPDEETDESPDNEDKIGNLNKEL